MSCRPTCHRHLVCLASEPCVKGENRNLSSREPVPRGPGCVASAQTADPSWWPTSPQRSAAPTEALVYSQGGDLRLIPLLLGSPRPRHPYPTPRCGKAVKREGHACPLPTPRFLHSRYWAAVMGSSLCLAALNSFLRKTYLCFTYGIKNSLKEKCTKRKISEPGSSFSPKVSITYC